MAENIHEEDKLGKAYDSQLVKQLLPYLRPHMKLVIVALVLVLLQVGVELVKPMLVRKAIDGPIASLTLDSVDESAWTGLHLIALLFIGVLLAELALRFFADFSLQKVGQRVIFDLRSRLFRHIQALPLKFYDRNPVGRLVTRSTSDMESIGEFFSTGIVRILSDLLKIIGILGLMMMMNFELSLYIIIFFPVMFFVTAWFRYRARMAFRVMRIKSAALNAFLNEALGGVAVTRIFAREKQQERKYDELNKDYRSAALETVQNFSMFFPAVQLVSVGATIMLLWVGTKLVGSAEMTPGTFAAFVFYTEMLFRPIREISERYTVLQSAMSSAERVLALIDEENDLRDPEKPLMFSPEGFRGEIEFKNVWFAYIDEEWVLKDASFKVDAGQALALVGSTGSGKTTIINLICRFYDIQKGYVLVDGVDVREYRKEDLRSMLGLVLQDVFLFAGSVLENLRLGDDSIPRERVEKAAELAGASTFIAKLEGGLDAPVAERGATFSTGQKQLIAFARSLSFDPRILILDEATANIDSETETLIQEAVERSMEGRTTVAVAHRLSTIRNADQILVLDHGEIVERGSHDELIAREGKYYRLYTLQFQSEIASKSASGRFPRESVAKSQDGNRMQSNSTR